MVLVSIFVVMEVFWYVVYVVGGYSLVGYLVCLGLCKVFDCVVGMIFIGFGLVLLCVWF